VDEDLDTYLEEEEPLVEELDFNDDGKVPWDEIDEITYE